MSLEVGPRTHLLFYSKVLHGLSAIDGARVVVGEGTSDIVTMLRLRVGGETYRIAIDLHDSSTRLDEAYLQSCDVYLKRSYLAADVPPRWRPRVRPFGLNFACRGTGVLPIAARVARHRLRDVREFGLAMRDFFRCARPAEFERPPTEAAIPAVLFQTRVWPEDRRSEEREAVNRERVELLRELRRAFGKRFVGGLYPDQFARRRYPDLVSPFPSSPGEFVRWAKQFRVAVYTRGLHGSIAFKMAEYLAGSHAIVSCPIVSELPQPLEAGRHLRVFRSVDECLAHCDALLSADAEAAALRREGWEYYRSFVEPRAHVRALLNELADELSPARARSTA